MGIEIFAFSGLINGLVALALGFFIISRNWKSRVNQLYFLLVVAVTLWSLSYWRWLSSDSEVSALFWVRMLSIGSTLIPVFYFHWVISLLGLNKKQKRAVWLVYFVTFLFLVFSFSDLFIKGVREKLFFPFWPDPGILYHFYLFFTYIILVTYSLYLLFKNYEVYLRTEEKKVQIVYILIGSAIAFGGGITNFFLWYDIPIPPYGNFLIVLYPFLFAYAILKHHLFNVKVIATELLIFAIWIFLLIKSFFALSKGNFQDFVVDAGLLILVIIGGVLLIKAVWNEVKQREKIEEMAKGIRRAYEVEKRAHKQIKGVYEKEKRALEIEKEAHKELKRLDEVKNQFMMATQHHLRTPLTSMSGYMDLLFGGSYGKIPSKIKNTLKRFQISTKRLMKIVEEFLDISQFQLGKQVVTLKEGVKIKDVLEEVIEELKYVAEDSGIYLKLEKSEQEPPPCMLDPEKLKAAFSNIIDNGIKYTRKGGVTVSYNKTDSKLMITIKDTGVGMTKEEQASVMRKTFERGKEARRMYTTGRGIGLYIASQIIQAHKGSIRIESEGKDKGSIFYIELPILYNKSKNKKEK